jgi:hypothetical protein
MQYTYFHIRPGVRDLIVTNAERASVSIQYLTALVAYGTDAAMIARSNTGTPTGTLAMSRRYAHCPYEVVNMNDAVGLYKVLREIVLDNGNKDQSKIVGTPKGLVGSELSVKGRIHFQVAGRAMQKHSIRPCRVGSPERADIRQDYYRLTKI